MKMVEDYIVFTGRPNAGKSTIIKEITGLNVVTGKRPGTTRRISKYPLNEGLFLVDMPGFGRVMGAPRRFEERAKEEILNFIESNFESIIISIHVLDISTFLEVTWRLERKGYQSLDIEMVQFLAETVGEFPIVAANKIDKRNKDEIETNLTEFMYRIGCGNISSVERHVFPVSARTREGLGALKSAIHETLVTKGYKTPFSRL